MAKYLFFEELKTDTKTKRFNVKNKLSNDLLGCIKWYAPWRKYCFFILSSDLIFDAYCLNDISDFINGLMAERKGDKQDAE